MRQFRHVWVFAGGDFDAEGFASKLPVDGDCGYIAVDRGVEHCLALGIVPTLLIGDFDSASPHVLDDERLASVPRQHFSRRKDASDLELALRILAKDPPHRVTLLGVSGGRTDHLLFNWLLPVLQDWPFLMDLVDATVQAFVVTPRQGLNVQARPGQLLSVLALVESRGVSTDGLEYGLERATLQPGSTIGLSNCVAGTSFAVSLSYGKLLVMLVTDQT